MRSNRVDSSGSYRTCRASDPGVIPQLPAGQTRDAVPSQADDLAPHEFQQLVLGKPVGDQLTRLGTAVVNDL